MGCLHMPAISFYLGFHNLNFLLNHISICFCSKLTGMQAQYPCQVLCTKSPAREAPRPACKWKAYREGSHALCHRCIVVVLEGCHSQGSPACSPTLPSLQQGGAGRLGTSWTTVVVAVLRHRAALHKRGHPWLADGERVQEAPTVHRHLSVEHICSCHQHGTASVLGGEDTSLNPPSCHLEPRESAQMGLERE